VENGPTHFGLLPGLDEGQERVLNACGFWVAGDLIGILRVALFDTNGNAIGTPPSTASITSVAGNASNVALLASSTSRRGVIIFNDSTAILYVALTETATASNFSYRLTPYATLELLGDKNFTGDINGIWSSATGNARITEMMA